MAFEPGKPKTGGRQKGTPNKRTQVLQEILESLGVDVPKEIVRHLNSDDPMSILGPMDRVRVLLDLMQYLYPKRKAIEVSGADGGPLELFLLMTPEERARRREELQKRLGTPSDNLLELPPRPTDPSDA